MIIDDDYDDEDLLILLSVICVDQWTAQQLQQLAQTMLLVLTTRILIMYQSTL